MNRPRRETDLFNMMDITSALQGWSFQPGQVNVRLIRGNDGKPKIQLRLDLGLLQMEIDGRPDGKKPHRAATELAFQQRRLASYVKRKGSGEGYVLSSEDCQALREESAMFYHRYLSLFVLEQYEAVVRDTQHNLDVLELCNKYGQSEYDRMCLEQYRPYILMMNIRAKACEVLRQGYVQTSIAYLRGGIRQLARMFPVEHRRKMLRQSNEAHLLLDMIKQIRAQLPPDPRTELRQKLKAALKAERYEEASVYRDQILAMTAAMARPVTPPVPVKKQRKDVARPEPRRTRARKKSDGPASE
ncbi:MAG TPA: UvrB/UvrC motif-containing protein [Phycisphaerae bacterium]|nr:UvrB/UvrC motif-containing protein [Phycisphaerae bacterium]